MKLSFHGAVGCVTGSCYLVTCGAKRFLVDCGMFQGCKALKERNYNEFPFDPASIDFVLLTHAHIDHSGLLPKLVKKGFKGAIYSTLPTVDFLAALLPDSARIQETEVELKNRRNERKGLEPLVPIYDEEDAAATIKLLKGIPLSTPFDPATGVKVTYRNAGHIFGSAFLEVLLQEGDARKKLVFSGDVGGVGHPIVKDPEQFENTDFLIIESTYGNRIRAAESNEERLKQLATVVKHALTRKGNLIIPSFALERTQDLMHDLTILMDRGDIPEAQITVDSPLAVEATKVYSKYPDFLDEDATALMNRQGKLFDHSRFKLCKSAEDSRALNTKGGQIILSASGMCDAGRIKHHLKHNLWRRESTVLFVGYQAEGTLGRMLLEGVKRVRIHGEEVKVEARIEQIMGYSGHADQNGLMDWLAPVKTIRDRVFVVHGEDEARAEFAHLLQEKRSFPAEVPGLDFEYNLLDMKAEPRPMTSEAKKALSAAAAVPVPATPPAAKRPVPSLAPTSAKPVPPTPASVPRGVLVPFPSAPTVDSYNLYADLMLRLADFMRRTPEEDARKRLMEKLLADLSR